MILATLGLLACLPAPQAPANPSTPAEMQEALGIKKVYKVEADHLEIWFEDAKQFKESKADILKAWDLATEWLGDLHLGEDNKLTFRIAVLTSESALEPFAELARAEAHRIGGVPPNADMASSASTTGSYLWTYPPVLLVSGRVLHKGQLTTRIIHDLGSIRARYAFSPWSQNPPEFWLEGFAGALMRHSMKRPAALVSHGQAAVSEKVAGYGVFSGIGSTNDASDNPGNWPVIIKNAVRSMRKQEAIDEKARVDQLLLRSRSDFARTDYAYSWAVMEFLLDNRLPVGAEAVEWAGNKKGKMAKTPPAANRRAVLLDLLAEMRKQEYAFMQEPPRTEKFRKLLLVKLGESPEQLHSVFMAWVERGMPKR